MSIHLAVIPVIMFFAGLAGVGIGGFLAMTFDISDRLPVLGAVLAFCGAASAVIAVGIQVGAWAGIR